MLSSSVPTTISWDTPESYWEPTATTWAWENTSGIDSMELNADGTMTQTATYSAAEILCWSLRHDLFHCDFHHGHAVSFQVYQ